MVKDPEGNHPSPWQIPRPNLNIRMVAFEKANIYPPFLVHLIRGIKFLRTFFYEIDGNMSDNATVAPDEISLELLRYAANSLEELHLVVYPGWATVEPWRHMHSLRSFSKLRTIEVDAELLCRSHEGENLAADARPLVEILPSTLQSLALRHLSPKQAEVLFAGFAKRSQRDLPVLKKLVLRHPKFGTNVEKILQRLRLACEEKEIEIQVEYERGPHPFSNSYVGSSLVERPAFCKNYPRP